MVQSIDVRVIEGKQLQISGRRRTHGQKHVIPSTLDILLQILQKAQWTEGIPVLCGKCVRSRHDLCAGRN